MCYIEFKAKIEEFQEFGGKTLGKGVALPKEYKIHHLKDRQKHRYFDGRIGNEILNVRCKNALIEMGIKDWFILLDELPPFVTVSGSFMATVRIDLSNWRNQK